MAFVGEHDLPVILPVNYPVDDELIVFRTAPGAKMSVIPMRPVAFEVRGARLTPSSSGARPPRHRDDGPARIVPGMSRHEPAIERPAR